MALQLAFTSFEFSGIERIEPEFDPLDTVTCFTIYRNAGSDFRFKATMNVHGSEAELPEALRVYDTLSYFDEESRVPIVHNEWTRQINFIPGES